MIFCLNSRQIEIIKMLIDSNEPISIKNIALNYGVTTRTIRYDIEIVEKWLNENESLLVRVPRKGIIISTNFEKRKLLDKLKFIPVENRVLSKSEKIKYLVLELFTSEKPLSIEILCKRLFFSKNTIMKILKDVDFYLRKYKLLLHKSSKGGFSIGGKEEDLRRLILTITTEIIDYQTWIEMIREGDDGLEINNSLSILKNFISIKSMKNLSKCFIQIEEYNNYYITDINFVNLILYIQILYKRFKQGCFIKEYSNTLIGTTEYDMAIQLTYKMPSNIRSKLPNGEINELAKYIIESKSFNTINELNKLSVSNIADEEVILITDKLISYIEEKINIDIKSNKQLYNSLVLHMRSAIPRIKNNNQMSNIYLDEIKENYPYIFQITKESVSKMISEFHNEVSDDEIGYIAIHIRSFYEENFNKLNYFNVLVVCQEGISFLNILTKKIKQNFPNLKLIGTCSVYDYERYKDKIDFVISTEMLNIKEIDVIIVSPFFSNKDIYSVNQIIEQFNKFRLIYKYNAEIIGGKPYMLKDIIDEGSIRTQVHAKDWKEAITEAGNILVEKDLIESSYIDNMIKAVKDLGPYIVVMPGIAFAHSKPDESIKKTCVSMITLKEPVEFGSKENDPVRIVFVFAAHDGNRHILALQDLAKFLSVDENVKFLLNTEDPSEIYKKLISD
jgi:mannitol operon transcriptional antiterminator